MSRDEVLIDVRSLVKSKSVEEHCRLAEEYFARLSDWTHHLSKPYGSFDETPQLLINFAVVLQGLQLCPGMTVLEFGAGTCWAGRILTQLGCKVIELDVSPTALKIGQELYARYPPVGERPAPQFLLFDGRHIELPDAGVDRIMCLDAFHHVPNPEAVLGELGRVLALGGIAGFAEPGPEHSRTTQSQYEMKTHGIIENDIDVRALWQAAKRVGFTDLKLAIFNVTPMQVNLAEFEDFLSGGKTKKKYAEGVRSFMGNQRNFFLYKGELRARDSRYRQGLTARIDVFPAEVSVREGETIRLSAAVENNSPSIWLPRSAGLGAVHLGCHVYRADGTPFRESYHWEPLTPGEGKPLLPGESIKLEVALPGLPRGQYTIEFDMVSNDVCWFAINGSQLARVSALVL